jgi:hypothetical protein
MELLPSSITDDIINPISFRQLCDYALYPVSRLKLAIEWKYKFTSGIALAVAKPRSLEGAGVLCMDLYPFAIKACLMGQSFT